MGIKLPRQRESVVQRSVKVRLARHGIILFRRNVGGFTDDYGNYVQFAEPGQSDLYGSLPPSHHCRHVELETKRPGNKPTPEQLIWLKESTARGWVAYWGDNADTIERVAEAVLAGGEIVWHDWSCTNNHFDVRMPE